MPKYFLYQHTQLKDYIIAYFNFLGVPRTDSETIAEVLLEADLRGVSSHGIIRLNTYYGNRIVAGDIKAITNVTNVHETATTLLLDGGNGMGHVAGKHAMQKCIEKAGTTGLGMVTVRNSNHYGIAGYYAMMAIPYDMIGISYTNSLPLVAPTYGRTAILGTNPIAVAVPAGSQRPYVLDMATSIVPIGRVTVYDKAGQPIPEGWGINTEGNVTTSPADVLHGGALMPLGGIDLMRGYKGYGLAMMVDIFSGILSGSAYANLVARWEEGEGAKVGHFFMAVDINAFRPAQAFKQDMDDYIQLLKNAPKAAGQERIYIPGEKEDENYARNISNGIPLLEEVVASLQRDCAAKGFPFTPEPVGIIED